MQKVYFNLHKGTNKDKPKEPKTTPVPVNDPKRAGQIREADKKLFEKLNKIGAVLVIGCMLFYGWYTQDISVFPGLGFDANPTHTPPLYHEQGLGSLFLPVPVLEAATTTQARDHAKPEKQKTPVATAQTLPKPVLPVDTRCNYVICEHVSGAGANSPLSGVLETVLSEWKKPTNTNILDVEKLGLEWKNEQEFIEKIKQNDIKQPLTLVTLELREFRESSGKDLYTLMPENKAKVKIILRGVDAATQRLLFEETIEKDVIQHDWANYETKQDSSQNANLVYIYSSAMKQALAETSEEIITLLHKYFP